MDTEASAVHGRTGIIIVILVIAGILVLGAGGYLAYSRRNASAASTGSDEAQQWCQIRQEWHRKVDPLAADIMLKSVQPNDRGAMEQLIAQREKLAGEFGARISAINVANEPGITNVEGALIKEGKARANTAVEIHNALVKINETDDTTQLNKSLVLLRDQISARIKQGKETADREISTALAQAGITCPRLYRGPATDVGTADSPYISWDELEMRRGRAERQYEERLKQLEPLEEYTNRVYHELIRQYRPLLVGCYKKAKAKTPSMSETLGLRVRLKKSGEVKTLAIEWMDNREESFLDCLLEKASKWKLPRPGPKVEVVVVTLDFAKI